VKTENAIAATNATARQTLTTLARLGALKSGATARPATSQVTLAAQTISATTPTLPPVMSNPVLSLCAVLNTAARAIQALGLATPRSRPPGQEGDSRCPRGEEARGGAVAMWYASQRI
jgi:hypothetical protein